VENGILLERLKYSSLLTGFMEKSLDAILLQAVQYVKGLTPREHHQLYKLFRLANEIPRIAKNYFSNPVNHADINARLDRLLAKTTDTDERASLAGGNMYASISYYLHKGDVHRFASAIRSLEQDESSPYRVLAKGLTLLGTSLLEMCVDHQQLLTPDQLDYVLFQRFAPASLASSAEYREKPVLVVVTPLPLDRYRAAFFFSSASLDEQDARKRLQVNFLMKCGYFTGSRDRVARKILGSTQEQSIREYGIVEVMTHQFEGYLFLRWTIEQAGRLAEQYKIPAPIGFKTVSLPGVEAGILN